MNKQQGEPPVPMRHPGGRFTGPVVKPKNQKETLLRIWSYLRVQKVELISVVIFVIISTLLSLVGPFLIGKTIDDYIVKLDVPGAIRMALILAGVYIASSVLTWLQTFVMIRVSQKTIRRLRQHLFEQYQSLPLAFYDKKQQGDLMSRMTNDIENLNAALSQSVIQIVSSFLTIVGTAFALFYLDWRLALVTLIIIPLIVYATKQIIKRSSVNYKARQRDLGNLNGYIEETISNADIITLFGQEKSTLAEFKEANERLRGSAMRADIISGFMGPINNFMNNLGLSLVIGAGAIMAVTSGLTIGVIASFVTYTRQFFRPINQLSNLLNTFQSAIAGSERVFEVLDETKEVADIENAKEKEQFSGDVKFENVQFAYETGKPVLHGINFEAKAGETVAIVGPTGSGKTTIIQLLTRFYDATGGRILLDGEPIEHYKMTNVRDHVGVVLQDTYLFSGTVRENIRFGKLHATDDEVEQAAKIAYAHNFIKYLPEQYDTVLTSGGLNLSQGQRQLIAIARAILEDPDILILDEATSSVDTMTEVHIQKGLNNLMEGRTSFVIAHRLKTIENADQILVIKDGQILEQGNHDSLMKEQGFYATLQRQLQSQ
ncbi:ABC-type multidrug transport system, ATPase and permease component [Solibacillus silvestris StLB046]|uniref:ABC-type multidrug transport system, ATPase and permease component n=2 Tax=Solibacillus TaxID=648800 RepID=F2F4E6_SOLSS|nr:ABC-type multidrug transport system, ATPase and permease component [Solibacillus silvestris StLB046]